MSHLPGKFVWFEHLSNDIAKARGFYEQLFGWHTETIPMGGPEPYAMIQNGSAGIGGYAKSPAGAPPQWLSYLSVDDVDASYRAALAAGAKSLMAPANYGGAGRAATLADPTGAVFSLWKGAQDDPADTDSTPTGGWFWNELTTQDDRAALAFYEKVFGYSHDEMPMAQGSYFLLKQGATMRGGLCKAMQASTPAMWMQYVVVEDCDAAAAKAKGLGATIVVPPADIPGVGRFSMLADPQGAVLAVMKPAPRAA
jgi:predicted enzyme related to lactoylglutathione lyase